MPSSSDVIIEFSSEVLLREYARLETLRSTAGSGGGRTSTLGWDLEYTSPDALLAFVDQILLRRMNDFIPDNDRPVILDCGANIGYTVLHYKRQYPGARITAFEPDPQFAPILRRNLSRNGASDVQLIEAAAWTRDGVAQWVMEGKDGSRLFDAGEPALTIAEVRTVDLSRYLNQDVDLLKIDIEGAEFDLLPHIAPRLGRVKNILVECHIDTQSDYESFGRVLTALRASGFTISFNSFGPWRDLTRRHRPAPLHATQYVIVAGWRAEHPLVSPEETTMPYVGAAQYRGQLQQLAAVEAQNRTLARMVADFATCTGTWDVVRLGGPFRRERGHCFVWRLPEDAMPGDSAAGGDAPTLLLEDDRLLGPGHAMHDDIRLTGGGRYSHWGPALYLSSSDNSDPNSNGRTYRAIYRRRQ